MGRFGRITRATATLVLATIAVAGTLVPAAVTAANADPSDVVMEFDFSASILDDARTRTQFADAIDKIAVQVGQQSDQLTSSDATVSMIQFASKAADYPGCVNLKLLDNPDAVRKFSGCLTSLAAAYRKGRDPALTAKIGLDTNYVDAMRQAAKYLPADAVRPALILFTDGRHDVKGVPASAVQPERNRLFGNRSPFALLPVGMGLAPKDRPALEAGLKNLQITKDMPTCLGGTTKFAWPKVVFNTPTEAGTAVATALQDATCTFTVAPTPVPTPPPSPSPVRAIRATAGDGSIELAWAPPATTPTPVVSYKARCRPTAGGDAVDSTDPAPTQPQATVEGLSNGTEYTCEVATVGANNTQGPWIPASSTATPIGKPDTPPQPGVQPLDNALLVDVAPSDPPGVSEYHVECATDEGFTSPAILDVPAASGAPTARIEGLQNGTPYVCRTFAKNAIGQSEASPLSAAVKPCGSLLDCNGLLAPVLGILGAVLALGLLAVAIALFREGRRGYVLAVVDVVHTANLGGGNRVGLSFVRAPGSRVVTGIVADKSSNADIRIRLLPGGRFAVRDGAGRHMTQSGDRIIAVVGGVRHELVLHAFETNAATPVARR